MSASSWGGTNHGVNRVCLHSCFILSAETDEDASVSMTEQICALGKMKSVTEQKPRVS